jgi:4-amino-4-deoxy-L-arabinose transferase-like glycosyltransferase
MKNRTKKNKALKQPQRPKADDPKPFKQIERFTSRFFFPLLTAITLLGFALRISDLRADPPPDLSWSFAPYTDESLNTYSARNLVLYGSWKQDDFLPFVIYPLVNMLVALVFKILGIGFVQVKLLSLLAGVLGIFVIALLVKEEVDKTAALLSALLLATCYPLVMYSRLGLVETVQILFLLLTGLFWVKGLKQPWLMFFCGICAAGTVLLVKISAIFIAPVMLILFVSELLKKGRPRELRSALILFLAGVLLALSIWFLVVFLPYRREYLRYVLRHSSESPAGHPSTLPAYLFNTFTFGLRSRLLPRMVFLAVLGFVTLPWLAKGQNRVLRYAMLVFVFGLLMLGYMNYRPPRYEIILLPFLLIASATALIELLFKGSVIPPVRKPTIIGTTLYSFWLWPLSLQLLLYIAGFRNYPQPGTESGIIILSLLLSLALTFAGYGLLKFKNNGLVIKSPYLRAALVVILLVLSLRLDFGQFHTWFSNRTYDLINYSKELDRSLPENAVVAGSWSPPLMIESRKRSICITDWANINDPINRFGVTHLILGENEADQMFIKKLAPDLQKNMTLLRTFRIRGQLLRVFALPAANKEEQKTNS